MSDTIESLRRKIESAGKIGAVVKTMKAIAASNINQFEMAVHSLGDYYRTITLGFIAYFSQMRINIINAKQNKNRNKTIRVLVVGSDIGLVGQFNEKLVDFVMQSLNDIKGKKEIWCVGERIQSRLNDNGLNTTKLFTVPGSVNYITPLVGDILIQNEKDYFKNDENNEFYIFHNSPKHGRGYEQISQRLLPFDDKWLKEIEEHKWPTNNIPQVAGEIQSTLSALIREYLFVSLFRVCAESLAAENASRLEAMQRAEKNIDELLEDLKCKFNRMRQDSIDEEIFDVIAGFEALKKDNQK
ncbi:MAG TPA: F0F1 ATP synthase subunit gamma [Bacteroidales bacterium]|nr:F0F1 ATP synthase subunit gamma [Bacteroidales bacterium]HPS17195.1 F0F1 ATP synthase subunit gamma [Bacteroidales bacterium]